MAWIPWPVRPSLVLVFFQLPLLALVGVPLPPGRRPAFALVLAGFGCRSPLPPAPPACCRRPHLRAVLRVSVPAPGRHLRWPWGRGCLASLGCPPAFLLLLVGPSLRLAAVGLFRWRLLPSLRFSSFVPRPSCSFVGRGSKRPRLSSLAKPNTPASDACEPQLASLNGAAHDSATPSRDTAQCRLSSEH